MSTSAIMGLGETLADYRDRGMLRRLRITPLRPWRILTSHGLTHLAITALGLVLLIGFGAVIADLSLPKSIGATALALVMSASAMISLGFLRGAVLPTVRTTQAVAAAIYFPAIFVSGALFPQEVLPSFAQRLGDVLPMTYAVRIIREAWTAGVVDWVAVAVLAGTTVVATAVAVKRFRWEAR